MFLTAIIEVCLIPFNLLKLKLNPLCLEDCLAKRRMNLEYFQGEGWRDHIAGGRCSIDRSLVCFPLFSSTL